MYLRDDPAHPRNMDDAGCLEEVASIFVCGIVSLRAFGISLPASVRYH